LHHCHENMMNACELLLMRARARRAYCKKCRVHIALEIVGRPNIPVLIIFFNSKYLESTEWFARIKGARYVPAGYNYHPACYCLFDCINYCVLNNNTNLKVPLY
jgi:hypothetical protein